MVTVDEVQRLMLSGADVVGPDGKKVGSVGQLFLDAESGEPAWVTVATGLFGRGESFVPLRGAVAREDTLEVAYDKDQVKHAPRIEESGGSLSPAQEHDLFRHYGLLPEDEASDAERREVHGRHAALPGEDVRHDDARIQEPGATRGDHALRDDERDVRHEDVRHDDAPPRAAVAPGDDAMVLHGERATVIGSEQVPTERVRLQRYTVTEDRTISVPVTREEYRIEYEPGTGEDALPPARDDRGGVDGPDVPDHRR